MPHPEVPITRELLRSRVGDMCVCARRRSEVLSHALSLPVGGETLLAPGKFEKLPPLEIVDTTLRFRCVGAAPAEMPVAGPRPVHGQLHSQQACVRPAVRTSGAVTARDGVGGRLGLRSRSKRA